MAQGSPLAAVGQIISSSQGLARVLQTLGRQGVLDQTGPIVRAANTVAGGLGGAVSGTAAAILGAINPALGAVAGIIGGLVSLFGSSKQKILHPIPAVIGNNFIAIRYVDPTISGEHFIDLDTGQTMRWSFEGNRFKPTGQVSPETLARARQVAADAPQLAGAGSSAIGTQVLPRINTGNQTSIQGILGDVGSIFGTLMRAVGTEPKTGPNRTVEDDSMDTLMRLAQSFAGDEATDILLRSEEDFVAPVLRQVEANRLETDGFLARLLSPVRDVGAGVLETVGDTLGGILTTVTEKVGNTLNAVTETLGKGINTIFDAASGVVNAAVERIVTFTESIIVTLRDVFVTVRDFIGDIALRIGEAAFNVISTIGQFASNLFDTVVGAISSVLNTAAQGLSGVIDTVRSAVTTAISTVRDTAVFVQEQLKGVFEALFTNVDSVVGTLRQGLESVPQALAALGDQFGLAFKESLGDPLESLATQGLPEALEALKAFIDEAATGQAEGAEAIFEQIIGDVPGLKYLADLYRRIFPQASILRLAFGVITAGWLFLSLIQGVGEAKALQISQEFALDNAYRLMSPPELVEARYRGIISPEAYDDQIRRQGLTSESGQRLFDVRENLPSAEALTDWKHRGFVDESTFTNLLQKSGWRDELIQHIRAAGFVLPPIQDLITMAVREVFDTGVVQRFGQKEDFPEEFAAQAEKLGLTREWAENYWAAHWTLPSPGMGFEMLQRDIISEDDLNTLLRALDIMPFWRPLLTKLAFNPLTRVDIRRMHKLRVLSDQEVFDAYRHIGYDAVNAQRLLDFTIALNRDKGEEDDLDTKTVTRNNILRFFTDGIINRPEAEELLRKAGYTADSIFLFITSAEHSLELDERHEAIATVIEQAAAGLITFDQAQDNMARLGLETVEMQRAVARLVRIQAQKTKLPTRSELDRMLKKRIIPDAVYLDIMQRLGYSIEWAERFRLLGQGEA